MMTEVGDKRNLRCAGASTRGQVLERSLLAAGSAAALTAARTQCEHDEHRRVLTSAYREAAANS